MSARQLYVLALNAPSDVRLTALSRQQGVGGPVPPLAEWLHLDRLDIDRVEMFPVQDLGDMPLATYVAQAYDIEAGVLAGASPRLNALDGSVLLVPSDAAEGEPSPGAEATLMATLPMTSADHSAAALPKSAARPAQPTPGPSPEPDPATGLNWTIVAGLAAAVLVVGLLVIWMT